MVVGGSLCRESPLEGVTAMGLDGVELVMEVEDAFGIEITDDEASLIVTVGDLHDCVLRKLKLVRSGRCLTAATFYRLRRSLVRLLGRERREVWPTTTLDYILPARSRRRRWPELRRDLGYALPGLCRPAWACRLIVAGCACLPVLSIVGARDWFRLAGAGWLAAATISFVALATWATRPLARRIRDCQTVGDLADAILACNFGKIVDEVGSVSEPDTWKVLTYIIAEQLGVRQAELTPKLSFVRDLNMD